MLKKKVSEEIIHFLRERTTAFTPPLYTKILKNHFGILMYVYLRSYATEHH